MTECRRTVERLTAYVDESLPPHERADVERHLGICAPCRASASDEAGARRVLRERAARLRDTPLPPGLRSRCEALARGDARTPGPAWWRRLVPAAVAALLVVLLGGAVISVATSRSTGLLAAQLAADHARCFQLFAPADAAPADARAVEAMFETRYRWDVHVPPSTEREGLQLVGGRRCLYADGRIPHLMYRVNGRPLSLFVLQGVSRAAADVTAFGHRARVWTRGHTTFVLVSPESAGELAAVSDFIRREAR